MEVNSHRNTQQEKLAEAKSTLCEPFNTRTPSTSQLMEHQMHQMNGTAVSAPNGAPHVVPNMHQNNFKNPRALLSFENRRVHYLVTRLAVGRSFFVVGAPVEGNTVCTVRAMYNNSSSSYSFPIA